MATRPAAHRLGALAVWLLLLAGSASALPVTVYEDLDLSGDYTPGEERTGGSNGDGGGSYALAFDLDASSHDISTAAIQLVLTTYDHNFEITVNGVVVVPLDPGNPAVFTPAVNTPWNANGNALPRLVIDLDEGAVAFAGSLTTTSTSLTSGLVYNQAVTLPVFQDGQNTILFVNPDDVGPDAIDFSISASIAPLPVPEPRSALLVLFGLALLARWRPQRSAVQ